MFMDMLFLPANSSLGCVSRVRLGDQLGFGATFDAAQDLEFVAPIHEVCAGAIDSAGQARDALEGRMEASFDRGPADVVTRYGQSGYAALPIEQLANEVVVIRTVRTQPIPEMLVHIVHARGGADREEPAKLHFGDAQYRSGVGRFVDAGREVPAERVAHDIEIVHPVAAGVAQRALGIEHDRSHFSVEDWPRVTCDNQRHRMVGDRFEPALNWGPLEQSRAVYRW